MRYMETRKLAIEMRSALRSILCMSQADGAVRYEEGVRYGVPYRAETKKSLVV